jgi:hypothetical protein
MARTKAIIWVRLCVRDDAESLHDQFGVCFRLVESAKELHRTPFGTTQQFLSCYCKVE